ncbi:MAG: hypothetical protein HKN91_02905 [Acidimicrobiia bacterium]|nr:hypothetical protein [Acidimicrobiia bacterium]
MLRISRLVVAVSAAALAVAACGDGQPTPTATAVPTSTTLAVGQRAPLATTKVPAPTTSSPPTSTVPPVTTTTEAVVAVGTVDNPIAVGSANRVGDWVITVKSVDEDAAATVLNENPYNESPADDERYVLVGIEASYIGGDTGFPWLEIDHWMLGEQNVLYKGFETECGIVPNDLSFIGEVFPGGTVQGSLCHRVAASDAAVAVLVIEEAFTIGDADAAVFALHDGVGSVPLEAPPTVVGPIDGGPLGSIGNPIEIGSPGMVGEWRVSVDAVDLDAAATILAENPFNDAPEPGFTYVLVTFEATYEGAGTGNPWLDTAGKILGEARVAYDGFDSYCGVIPDDFTSIGEVQPGTTVIGNMCWAVATDDLESLMVILEDHQNYESGRLFYALG